MEDSKNEIFKQEHQVTEGPLITKMPNSRKTVHVIILIIGWGIYFAFVWSIIALPNARPTLNFIFWYSLACFIFLPLLTLYWIRHNVKLAKKHEGRRKQVHWVPDNYVYDWEGRTLVADWQQLRKAQKITITMDDNAKKFIVDKT